MWIIGCDFHPSWQQVAWLEAETGETGERKLVNGDGEAERFYRALAEPALVGVEACGNSQWLVELLQQLGHEVWIGDAAQIRASYVRKQKTDKRDAAHILRLLLENRFPRIWVASAEQRDVRQLLLHRHKLVEIRTRVKNGLQHLAMNRGMQKKRKLWSRRTESAARTTAARLGRTTASRSAGVAEESGRADWRAGPGGGRRSSARQNGAAVADASGGGADHGTGVCGDHRGCFALSARQAGGQLSGVDSARAQLGRTAAAGCHQQTGQSLFAHVAGGSGAQCQSEGRRISQELSAALPSHGERRGPGGGGAQVGRTTLLDAAHQHRVSGDRSDREQPAGAPGRSLRRLDR